MAITLITEDIHLPSDGKFYDGKVNPISKIRAMTTDQEMRRLSHSEKTYKSLCEIADECIVGDPLGISTYDLTIGDYQYILLKLRIATYGSEYRLRTTCPNCFKESEIKADLDQLSILSYTEDIEKYLEFDLPRSGDHIKLRPQTPRSYDDVQTKATSFMKKARGGDVVDPTLIYTIAALIGEVNNKILDPVELDRYVRSLPMVDVNYILKANDKVQENVGINPLIPYTCSCGVDYNITFRITSEFFRPSID